MPEGDALHRIAASLQVLVGERVAAESPHPRGALTGVAELVDGRVLESVEAVGKNLLLTFSGGVRVQSHLRMTGRWRVQRRGERVLGRPWLVLRGREWEALQRNGPVLRVDRGVAARIGPDILGEVEISTLARRVATTDPGRSLGEALLDQRLVAGIGNMWMAEALWQARISPWLPVGEVGPEELEVALAWSRAAMRASVAGRREGRAVYRRAGRGCRRCGEEIRSRGLGDANRMAYWCPGCQRGVREAPPAAAGRSDGSRRVP
jgi:endonuclease-8